MNCFDTAIASVVSWYGKSYELMFINAWGFNYWPFGLTLGNRIRPALYNILQPLEIYQGIKFHIHFFPLGQHALTRMTEEFQREKPVILETDFFWVPWNGRYQKQHRRHYLVLTGVEGSNVLGVDYTAWNRLKKPGIISFNDLLHGMRSYITVSNESYRKELNWRQIINRYVRLRGSNTPKNKFDKTFTISKSCFDRIRRFADSLEKVPELRAEKQMKLKLVDTPLFVNLNEIVMRRFKFSFALGFLGNQCNVDELVLLAKEMESIGNEWEVVKNILYQSFECDDSQQLIKQSAFKIRELADKEETLSKELWLILNK